MLQKAGSVARHCDHLGICFPTERFVQCLGDSNCQVLPRKGREGPDLPSLGVCTNCNNLSPSLSCWIIHANQVFLTEICFVHNKLEEQLPHAGALPKWEELLPKELPFQFSVAWKNLNPLLIAFCLFPKDLGTLGCRLHQITKHCFQERKGAAYLFPFPSVGSGEHQDSISLGLGRVGLSYQPCCYK